MHLTWHGCLPRSGVCLFGIPPSRTKVPTSRSRAQQPTQGLKEPDYPERASCTKSKAWFW